MRLVFFCHENASVSYTNSSFNFSRGRRQSRYTNLVGQLDGTNSLSRAGCVIEKKNLFGFLILPALYYVLFCARIASNIIFQKIPYLMFLTSARLILLLSSLSAAYFQTSKALQVNNKSR